MIQEKKDGLYWVKCFIKEEFRKAAEEHNDNCDLKVGVKNNCVVITYTEKMAETLDEKPELRRKKLFGDLPPVFVGKICGKYAEHDFWEIPHIREEEADFIIYDPATDEFNP